MRARVSPSTARSSPRKPPAPAFPRARARGPPRPRRRGRLRRLHLGLRRALLGPLPPRPRRTPPLPLADASASTIRQMAQLRRRARDGGVRAAQRHFLLLVIKARTPTGRLRLPASLRPRAHPPLPNSDDAREAPPPRLSASPRSSHTPSSSDGSPLLSPRGHLAGRRGQALLQRHGLPDAARRDALKAPAVAAAYVLGIAVFLGGLWPATDPAMHPADCERLRRAGRFVVRGTKRARTRGKAGGWRRGRARRRGAW